jgi:hypothetical protein
MKFLLYISNFYIIKPYLVLYLLDITILQLLMQLKSKDTINYNQRNTVSQEQSNKQIILSLPQVIEVASNTTKNITYILQLLFSV